MGRRVGLSILIAVSVVGVLRAESRDNGNATKVAPAKSVQQLSGTGDFAVASRWHIIEDKQLAVGVDVAMTESDLVQLFEGLAGTEDDADEPTIEILKGLAGRTLVGMRFKPNDAGPFERFCGSGEIADHACVIEIRRTTVTLVKDNAQPTVKFEFDATVITSGRYGDRFGPNTWRNDWQYKMTGAIVRLTDDRCAWQSLSLSYSVDGKFYTPGASDKAETWTSRGEARLLAPADAASDRDAKRLGRVNELIDQLGSASYWDREAAQTELQPLAREFRSTIQARVADHTDAEVRMRLHRILKQLDAEKATLPPGWFVAW